MGVAFVTGMQGDDPKYYRVISTPKHYAVHSGPESTRHKADVMVSKHDQLDTYLPAFRATVTEARAASVMCAYNSINGQPACVNEFLLQDQLRNKWKFQGYVVSDCDAVVNIFRDHHFTKTQPEASALAIQRGMDNECIDFAKVKDDHDYRPYYDAYKQGFLKESEIDTALIRLFTARMKLGMFDPPEIVPYTKIDEKELDSAEHRALARTIANESMVLLKNDGTLPLKQGKLKIALVGPLADQTKYLLGNYSGSPTHIVSVLDGMKTEFPEAQINFVAGTQFLRADGELVPESALTNAEGQPGLTAKFSSGVDSLAETHALLGQFRKMLDYNWSEVQREMALALELNPSSLLVKFRYAISGLMPVGRLDEAVAELETVLDLDPLNLEARRWLGLMHWWRRDYDRAVEQAQLVLAVDPNYPTAHVLIGVTRCAERKFDEAIPALRRCVELSNSAPVWLGWLGLGVAQSGDVAEAHALLARLHAAAEQTYIPASCFAWIHLGLGELDEAFAWMNRAVDQRDPMMTPIKSYEFFDPIRSDPRFAVLLRKMNLEP
jgi:tetratricopeptide (TPR) repeat protein